MTKQQKPITPEEAIDTIEQIAGKHPGCRRAHTKGIACDAVFQPNGAATPFTTAGHLQNSPIPTIVRFSHTWPSPDPIEALVPFKGMAVRFQLPDGSFTHLTMANIPVFITKTPEAFIRLMQTMTKEPLSFSEKFKVLRESPEYSSIPELLKQMKPPSSFATETYHTIHAYYLVNEVGKRQAVRFRWEPIDASQGKGHGDKSNLEDELSDRLERMPVQFKLLLQLAEADDPVNDPSVIWPEERILMEAGILSLQKIRTDGAEEIVFDPTATVPGIELTDDPVLHYRSAVYEESARRRKAGL